MIRNDIQFTWCRKNTFFWPVSSWVCRNVSNYPRTLELKMVSGVLGNWTVHPERSQEIRSWPAMSVSDASEWAMNNAFILLRSCSIFSTPISSSCPLVAVCGQKVQREDEKVRLGRNSYALAANHQRAGQPVQRGNHRVRGDLAGARVLVTRHIFNGHGEIGAV